MRNLGVKFKMTIIVFITVILATLLLILSYTSLNAIKKNSIKELEASIREDYDQQIKGQVESVITILQQHYQAYHTKNYLYPLNNLP